MKIDEEIKQINDEISKLRDRRIRLIREYVKPYVEKAIKNINQFKTNCGFKFEVRDYNFDDMDELYNIRLNIPDKEFKSRLEKKHQIIDIVYKSVDDDFAHKKIMITGAI